MDAINWLTLLGNALWIIGAAAALAAFSYADWQRRLVQPRLSLRQALGRPAFQAGWSLALLLVCAGMALLSDAWWLALLWAVLALAFLYLGSTALLRKE
ncbi:MAG: hypothetical protein ABTQ73_04860 [Caldilineales bacterium]